MLSSSSSFSSVVEVREGALPVASVAVSTFAVFITGIVPELSADETLSFVRPVSGAVVPVSVVAYAEMEANMSPSSNTNRKVIFLAISNPPYKSDYNF